jgi:hypothetical protein
MEQSIHIIEQQPLP